MNDLLVDAALIGTTRQPDPPRVTGTPIDEMVAGLPASTVERDILLAAGALAVYRHAGRMPVADCLPPRACPDDPRPALEGHRASVIGDLLQGRAPVGPRDRDSAVYAQNGMLDLKTLLPEALEFVNISGHRLPHHLLIAALDVREAAIREAILPVLGERGHWLAQFNKKWRWAVRAEAEGQCESLDSIWAEGTPDQRLAALGQMRDARPDLARTWVVATWPSEKADFKVQMLRTLEPNISLVDQSFLEQALLDRSDKVRECAADLLHRLPGSALLDRLIAIGDECLSYSPPSDRHGGLARLLGGGGGKGSIEVRLPPEEAVADGRLGIYEHGSDEIAAGRRTWYLARILSLIPPNHWCERFAATPDELIAAASRGEWADTAVESWARAAIRHRDHAWIAVVWKWWIGLAETRDRQISVPRVLVALFSELPEPVKNNEIVRLLRSDDPDATRIATELLPLLPAPWSTAAGKAYITVLNRAVGQLPRHSVTEEPAWISATLIAASIAARRLPPECWESVPPNWDLPDEPRYRGSRRWLDMLSEHIHLRQYLRRTFS